VIQFGRLVTVQLGTEGSTGRELFGLKVRFDIAMNDGSTPNSGKIQITNPAPDTIALAQQEGAVLYDLLEPADTGNGR